MDVLLLLPLLVVVVLLSFLLLIVHSHWHCLEPQRVQFRPYTFSVRRVCELE